MFDSFSQLTEELMQGNLNPDVHCFTILPSSNAYNLFPGIQMLTLLVPILINYLLEPDQFRAKPKQCVQLHEQSLQWLMKIGPKYPQEFKTFMAQSPELRARLEVAIKRNQATSQMQAKNKSEAAARASVKEQQKPTIQLKTDFSNFGTT